MTDQEIVILIQNLSKIQPNRWYKLTGREDAENLIQVIKLLIDSYYIFGGDEYVISNDYSSFMKKGEINYNAILPYHQMELGPEYKIKSRAAKKNFVWEKQMTTIHEIYFNDKLIAIETC